MENNISLTKPIIKVIGLGGGGSNAVSRMMELGFRGVDYIAANTDYQALKDNPAPTKILLGPNVTRGLGAGGDPRIGHAAAKESYQELSKVLSGADMVFMTAGMGGGTGTGAIPVVAEIARNLAAVTIAVVTTPFSFELGKRQTSATEGLAKLREFTHTMIAIPNDRLLKVAPPDLPLEVAFRLADDVLRQAVQGIAEIITEPGLINVDFAHVRRIMRLGGGALMSIGFGEGEKKVFDAIEQALHHPLLEDTPLTNSKGLIINFTGGADLSLSEVEEALNYISLSTSEQAEIVLGVIQDERMEGRVQVILVITGIGASPIEEVFSPVISKPQNFSQIDKVEPIPLDNWKFSECNLALDISTPINPNDLDMPAFIRRRSRHSG